MRWLLAMIKHETNTFSPVPTPLERFFRGSAEPVSGDAAVALYDGTNSGLAGYLDVARETGADVTIPVAAAAWPSGPATAQTYRQLCQPVLDELARGGYDAVLLDLHGAMVTSDLEDAEGDLLRRIREIAPDIPVAVTLDMHANLYDDMVRHATVISGYHTYPHVDIHAAAVRAARIVARALKGEIRPVMAWGNRPMLPHVLRQGTHVEPNRSLQARCIELETQGQALAASVFVGFPHADIREAGLSAVVCTDASPAQAEQLRDELLDRAWATRADWVYHSEALQPSVARAAGIEQGPVVLLDHCDNAASGGSMDNTTVLAEILRQGLDNVAFYAIYDPDAAQQAARAGVGQTVTLSLGGKIQAPALRQPSLPLEVTGRVKLVFDGLYRSRGPMGRGTLNDTGLTVVIDTGRVEIVVISGHQEPYDVNCLLSAGIDPTQKRYLALKSRMHWRAGYADMATAIIECAGNGVTTSDYSQIEFKRVRRPIYPLDPM